MSIKEFNALLRGGSLRPLVDVAAGARRQLADGGSNILGWTDW